MKAKIDKLILLARNYHDYAKKAELIDELHIIRDNVKEPRIRIYLADRGQTCSVDFGNVNVCLYGDKITMPFYITDADLDYLYNDAIHVYNQLIYKLGLDEINQKETIIDKINKLQNEINRLKPLIQ